MSKRQLFREKRKKRARINRILSFGSIIIVIGLIATFFILNSKSIIPQRNIVDGFTAGDPNAPIKVVEYADFQCPSCQYVFVNIEPVLVKRYINKGKVFLTFEPLSFLGPESFRAAEAAFCASDQNKFWEYHDLLFENWSGENQGAFSDTNLIRFANQINFDQNAFQDCFESGKYIQKVKDKATEIYNAGITRTPTFLVNGQETSVSQLLDVLASLSGE